MAEDKAKFKQQEERVVRAFISSTFSDMHAERDHLVAVVFPELRERVERLGLEFFDVDLRWGVPRVDVDGERANSWKYCKQWIERVEPFFICLLGERYGYIPPPDDLVDPADRQMYAGLSITEMEIRHAVLSGKLSRNSYFYFRKTPVPENTSTTIYQSFVEPHRRNHLARLKAEIKNSSTKPVREYACRWNGSSFEALDEFGRQVLEDLWSGILRDGRFVALEIWQQVLKENPLNSPVYRDQSQPVPKAIWEKLVEAAKPLPTNPLDAEKDQMAAFAASRLFWFRGREDELARLRQFVGDEIEAAESKICVVRGVPGQGKSALMAKLAAVLDSTNYFVLSHFVGATERSTEIHWLLERLNGEIERSDLAPPDAPLERDLRRRLKQRLESYNGARRIVLILDGINQLYDGLDLEWLPEQLGPQVRMILSCVDVPLDAEQPSLGSLMKALLARAPLPLFVHLQPLGEDDVKSIVVDYLEEYCKRLDAKDIENICRLEASRNPLYLLVMLGELRSLGGNRMHEIVPELIAELQEKYPDTVSLFDWVLERLEVFGEDAVSQWCAYLCLGRKGMSSRELSDLLARRSVEEGARTAQRIERGLRRYLLKRGTLLGFYHDQLRQAAEQRYLTLDNRQTFHQQIARYFLERGIDDEHALSELPFQLRQANLEGELYQLIAEPEFQTRKVKLRGSVFDLCVDILQAFDVALEHQDLANIARYGFLHAQYSEGQFTKSDVLQLNERDRQSALAETRLYLERPRFRLLLLLALREAEAGQTALANELVSEALRLKAIKLKECDTAFLSLAVKKLLEMGGNKAAYLLGTGLPPEQAAQAAIDLSDGLLDEKKGRLLEAAIGWLEQNISGFSDSKSILNDFEKVIEKVCGIQDSQLRDSLFEHLENLAQAIRPAAEQAAESDDALLMSLVLSLMFSSNQGSGVGTQYAAQAFLGAALINCGQELKGAKLIEEVIEKTDAVSTDAVVFGGITKALLKLPEAQALSFFKRFFRKVGDGESVNRFGNIIDAIGDAKSSAARNFLDLIAPAVEALTLKKRAALLERLSRAAFLCDHIELARRYAPVLSDMQFFLLSRSPFLAIEGRMNIVRQQISAKHFSRLSDAREQRQLFKKYARLIQHLETEKSRVGAIRKYAALCAEIQDVEGLSAVFEVVEGLASDEQKSEALKILLQKTAAFDEAICAQFRQQIFAAATTILSDNLRVGVLSKWLACAWRPAELEMASGIRVDSIKDAPSRADFYAELAGALLRYGDAERAQFVWQCAAQADQEALSRPLIFVTRMSACARSSQANDWQEVLQASRCPDFEIAAQAVEAAANACTDAAKLDLLGKEIRRHQWHWAVRSNLARMYFSVAGAFARIGHANRGAKIALDCLKENQVDFETASQLIHDRSGLRLLLKMILKSGVSENLARIFATIPEKTWQQEAFHELYLRALGTESHISKWDRVTAVGEVARAIASCGQKPTAEAIIRREMRLLPKAEANILRPQGEANAMLSMGRAMAAAQMLEAQGYLQSAIDLASQIKGANFRSEAFSIVLAAWKELQGASGKERLSKQYDIESLAYKTVEEIPQGMGDKYKPLVSLAGTLAELERLEEGLFIAQQIESAEDREEAMIGLLEKARSSSDKQKIWKQIQSANGRKRAAKILADKFFEPDDSTVFRTTPKDWKTPFRESSSVETLFIIVLFLATVLLPYWAFWKLFPFPRFFIAALVVAVILAVKPIADELKSLARKSWQRLPIMLFGLLLAPVLWAVHLTLFLTNTGFPRWRAWKFIWLKRPPNPPAPVPVERQMAADFFDYFQFLRLAVNESAMLDTLLAPLLYLKTEQAEIRRILDALPPAHFPQEPPAALRQNLADYEEAERAGRLSIRLKNWLRKLAVKAGVIFTAIFVYPFTVIQGTILERRYRKALNFAVKGNDLLNNRHSKDALPYLRRAVELDPEKAQFWGNYAIALADNKQLDEAIKAFRKAIRLSVGGSQEFVHWYNLAYNLFYAGRYEEALECFERVVEIAPRDDEFYSNAIQGCEYCRTNLRFRK
jgi:hypothetical protein